MMSEMTTTDDKDRNALHKHELDRRLNAASGGLFLIWVGIAMLADVGWGLGLVGVGIIILGEQAARRFFAIKFDTFWIVIGTLFIIGGIFVLFGLKLSLVPLLLIAVGISLLVSIFKRSHKSG
jgi:hypothetical protein